MDTQGMAPAAGGGEDDAAGPRAAEGSSFPLGPLQRALLLESLRGSAYGVYVTQPLLSLEGALDPRRLAGAWEALVKALTVLRTVFIEADADWHQQVVPAVDRPLRVEDLAGLSSERRQERVREVLEEERARCLPPGAGPLHSLTLLRHGPVSHQLLFSHHHALLDGWSFLWILEQLLALYQAGQAAAAPALPPVARYSDYVEWLGRQEPGEAQAFWCRELTAFPGRTAAPAPAAGAAVAGRPRELEHRFGDDLLARLSRLAHGEGVTLTTLVQCAVALLLGRYTGREEVVLGAVSSCRLEGVPRARETLGLLVNTLPLRVRLVPGRPLQELLREVRERFRAIRVHGHHALAEIQQWAGVGPGEGLFDVIVGFDSLTLSGLHSHAGELRVAGLTLFERPSGALGFAFKADGDLSCRIFHDPTLCDPAIVHDLPARLTVLLRAFCENPQQPLGSFSLVSPAEWARLVQQGRGPRRDLEPFSGLAAAFAAQVRARPQAQALIADGRTLSYAELDREADAVAALLRCRGVIAGDLVGLLCDRSWRLIAALLGLLKAGAAYLPIDPEYPPDRIALLLRESGARWLLGDREPPAGACPVERRIDLGAAVAALPAPITDVRPDHPAYVIYTSGSTGRPKGVVVPQCGVLNLAGFARERLGIGPGDRVVQFASVAFDSSVWEIFSALLNGAALVLTSRDLLRDAELFQRLLEEHAVTVATVPPAFLFHLDPSRISALRVVVSAGAELPPALVERWRRRVALFNGYGPTEATVGATLWQANEVPLHATPLGDPWHNATVFILDGDLNPQPPEVPGELFITGAGLALGYLHAPRLTAERFVPNPFASRPGERLYRTGDLARRRADGTLEFVGRRDQQIKIRGYRVEPGEVEAAMRACPGIEDAVVTVQERPGLPARLAGYYISAQGLTPEALRGHLTGRLPAHLLPGLLIPLPSFPLTVSGKVDRARLPSPEPAATRHYDPPVSEAERLLTEIWCRVLRVAQVGVNDNFFELGGDSIVGIQVAAEAAEAGYVVRVHEIFEHPTPRRLASRCVPGAQRRGTGVRSAGEAPLLPIQQWFFEQVTVAPDHWDQTRWLAVPADLTPDLLRAWLGLLIGCHDALRLRFRRDPRGLWHAAYEGTPESPPVAYHDLRGLAEKELPVRLEALAATAESSLSLSAGPLLRAVLCDLPGERLLLLTIHHLVVDAVSWQILIDDLNRLDRQHRQGLPLTLPPEVTGYGAFGELLRVEAAQPGVVEEAAWWTRKQLLEHRTVAVSAGDDPDDTVAASAVCNVVLEAEHTRALLGPAASAYNTRVNEFLMCAVARALRVWSGAGALRIDLEGHGREAISPEVDLTRTVGWFTTIYPLLIEVAGGDPGADLLEVKEQLRAVPRRGIGYGVLRYLSPDRGLREQLAAVPGALVSFNYLGRAPAAAAGERLRPREARLRLARHPAGRRSYPIEMVAWVEGERLFCELHYGTRRYPAAAAGELARLLREELERLIGHCMTPGAGGRSPSDYPLARLSAPALAQLLTEVGLAGRPREVEAIYPLSPLQEGLLVESLKQPGTGIYVNQAWFAPGARLEPGLLEKAWRRLSEEVPVLRSVFSYEQMAAPLQVVLREAPPCLRQVDLRGLSAGRQETELHALAARERLTLPAFAAAPCSSLLLVRLGQTEWRLIWTHHHILMDGWSLPRLSRALGHIYAALLRGESPPVSELVPYQTYIEWLLRQDRQADELFWRGYLTGFNPPVLGLQAGEEPAPGEEYGVRELEIPEAVHGAWAAAARGHQVTVNTLAQAALGLLLTRYYGCDELMIGMAVSGRDGDLAGLDRVVGLITNTVPLRLRMRPDQPLGELLAALMVDAARVNRHGRAGLQSIRQWAGLAAGNALFDVVLAYENYPVLPPEETVLDLLPVAMVERPHSPFTLAILPGERFRILATWQRRLFGDAQAERLLGQLLHLLDELSQAAPSQPVATIPWLPEPQRRAALAAGLAPQSFDRDLTVIDLVDAQVRRTPDAEAVIDGDRVLTYAALSSAAALLAGEIAPGLVGICMERSAALVVSILATLRCGGAYLPLDPDLPRERLAALLEEARPVLVLVDAAGDACLAGMAVKRLRVDPAGVTVAGAHHAVTPPAPALRPHPGDLAYLLYTSGSTGRPKGVMVPHGALANHMQWMAACFPLGEDDRVLQRTPFHFDASVWEFFAPLMSGAALVLLPPEGRNDMRLLRRVLSERRITVLQMVPSLLKLLLDEEGLRGCPSLRRIFCGGEELTAELVQRVQAESAAEVCNLYGPTECTIDASFEVCARGGARRQVPIGRPVANVALHLLDRGLEPLPEGLAGELYIGGDCLAWGYLGNPRLTAERFIPDPLSERPGSRLYRSGDLVCRDHSGGLTFLGRADHQIKIRGNRVEPGEIEARLRAHPAVADALVAAHTTADGRSLLAAWYLPADGPTLASSAMQIKLVRRAVDPEALRRHLSAFLPDYMVPSCFIPLDAWPLTPSGKVDRLALPPPFAGAAASEAPASAAEQALAEIWREVLKVSELGVTDNFFELGGDSILSIQVASRARRLGLRIGVKEIFAHPTIRELVRHCGRDARAAHAPQELVEGEQVLLPAQRRFFVEEFRHPDHWNQSLLLELPDDPGCEAIGQMLALLVERHDALRLRFTGSPPRARYGAAQGSWVLDECLLPVLPDRREAEEAACRAAQAGLSLAEGPLLRGVLLRGDGQIGSRLFLTIHHLVSDAVSLRILVEDLAECYRAWSAGRAPALPAKTTSLQYWGERLREHAAGPRIAGQLAWWSDPARAAATPVLVDFTDGPDCAASQRVVAVELEPPATRLLLERANEAFGTRVEELLLCALVRAWRGWCGGERLLIELEGHGREPLSDEVDVARTVGWFTTAYPLLLQTTGGDLGADIRAVKEGLRAVPDKGIGYGLLAFLGDDPAVAAALGSQPHPEVSFNYLGQFDQSWGADVPFRVLDGIAGLETDPREKRTHLIDVVGKVREGQLTMLFIYSCARHREATIATLAQAWLAALRELIDYCLSVEHAVPTPSDFPLADITETALTQLLEEVGTRQAHTR